MGAVCVRIGVVFMRMGSLIPTTKDDALYLELFSRPEVMKDAGFKGHRWIFPWIMLKSIFLPKVMNG